MRVEPKFVHAGYHNNAGERIPSVTTLAKMIDRPDALIWWAWDCGMKGIDYKKVRDDAATIGHVGHALVEARIKGQPFDESGVEPGLLAPAKESLQAFDTWCEASQFVLLETEVKLISERYQFGGRLDCVATVTGETCIVDFKTSKGVYESYLLQVSAYRHAWNETHKNRPVMGCHLLRLKKDDAGFVHHYFPPKTLDKAFTAFLLCRELYDLQKELKKLI